MSSARVSRSSENRGQPSLVLLLTRWWCRTPRRAASSASAARARYSSAGGSRSALVATSTSTASSLAFRLVVTQRRAEASAARADSWLASTHTSTMLALRRYIGHSASYRSWPAVSHRWRRHSGLTARHR